MSKNGVFISNFSTSHSAIAKLLTALLLACGIAVAFAGPALAHDELVGTSVELNADADQVSLLLEFNNEVMDIGTELVATDTGNNNLLIGNPVVSGRTVTQALARPELSETVTVAWRVVSSDGHPISGKLGFVITELNGTPTVNLLDAAALSGTDATAESSGATGENTSEQQPQTNTVLIVVAAVGIVGALAAVIIGVVRRKDMLTDTDNNAKE